MEIPTYKECRAFADYKNLNVDADAFYRYCIERDWKMKSGEPIKNWQGIMIQCHRNGNFKPKKITGTYRGRNNSIISEREGCIHYVDEHGTLWAIIDENNADPADDYYKPDYDWSIWQRKVAGNAKRT